VGDDNVDGVYIGYGGGGVSPLVEVGSPEEFLEIHGVAMSSDGTVAFVAKVLIDVESSAGLTPSLRTRFFTGPDPYAGLFGDFNHSAMGPFEINNNRNVLGARSDGRLFTTSRAVHPEDEYPVAYTVAGGQGVNDGVFYAARAINNVDQVAWVHRAPDQTLVSVRRAEVKPVTEGYPVVTTTLADGFESISSLSLDDSGRAVFVGQRPGESTMLYESSGSPVVLASKGDGQGFSNFSRVAVSAGGQIAFSATYTPPSGPARTGIFRGFNGAADKIVASGDQLIHNNKLHEISGVGGFGPRAYNGSQVLFRGSIRPVEDDDDDDGGDAGPASIRPSSHSGSHSGLFITSGVGDPPPDDEPSGDDPEDDPENTFTWVNNSGGAFATASNWEPAQVPVRNSERTDTARFDLGANYTVDTPAAATERLLVRGGDVTLNVGTYTVGSTDPNAPSVSITRSGILRVTGGSLQSVNTTIGHGSTLAGQVAEAHLFNSGVTWDNPGRMTIGGVSAGRLFVANGPTLTTGEARLGSAARGEAIVGGTDSLWDAGTLAVGYSDEGSLIIERGGHTVAEFLYIGRPEGQGVVTVDGVGADGTPSLLTVNNSLSRFWIGEGGGEGELRIIAGGMTEATDGGFLGVGSKAGDLIGTGRVSVRGFDAASGARSTLTVAPLDDLLGWIALGWEGDGRLDIENGGLVESGESYVAKDGGVAVANVTGVGNGNSSEWLVEGLLAVGYKGVGDINLADGGQITTDHVIAGSHPEGRGQDHGRWSRSGRYAVAIDRE
jgi:T5SS/PEP-CTERM-associated repeat protein